MEKISFILLALMLNLVACTENLPVDKTNISCEPSTIVFPSSGGTKTVAILSNSSWTATASEDWITIYPSSGQGDSFVKVICSAGLESDAMVIFSSGEKKCFLTITRNANTSGGKDQGGSNSDNTNPNEGSGGGSNGTSTEENTGKTEVAIQMVDLGLSVKWANKNIGASAIEDYGDFFAWGETISSKNEYDWSDYKYCRGTIQTLTKYCTDKQFGNVDGKTILEAGDDAAHVHWGGNWRMPTKEEQDELARNCTWVWTTQNGVIGCKVTSNRPGYTNKSIFLPAAGSISCGSNKLEGVIGLYGSCSLQENYPCSCHHLYFKDSGPIISNVGNMRCVGRPIRPVCP